MFCDLAYDVHAIAQPRKLAARRRRKDRDLAIFALVSVLHEACAFVECTKAPAFAEAFTFARCEVMRFDYRRICTSKYALNGSVAGSAKYAGCWKGWIDSPRL